MTELFVPEDCSPPEDYISDDVHFFDVVNSLTELYVTFRGRYVVAINGKMFIPHVSNGQCKKLDNAAIIGHLNQKYALGVFSTMTGSKFLCFDIDLPEPEIVHKVMHGLCEFGVQKELIYVSSSGGKGFHVEIFFTGLIYLNLLHDLYRWVIDKEGLDPKKVEFRPTFGQAIKLPLSKHHKTGNVCWYLDRDTLEPIRSMSYITTIVQMDRDSVEDMIRCKIKSIGSHSEDYSSPTHVRFLPSIKLPDYGDDPMMTGPGMRHNLMKSIAVHERYKGTSQEEIEAKLKEWVAKQNPDFFTDPMSVITYDAESLASFVWSDKFVVANRKLTITRSDLETVLSCRPSLQKRVLFLILLYCRRYGAASMSLSRIARNTRYTQQGVQKALSALENKGLIAKKPGKVVYSKGQFAAGVNTYTYRPQLKTNVGENIEIRWDFKEESFIPLYLDIFRNNVMCDDWKKYFTAKEIEELKQKKEND